MIVLSQNGTTISFEKDKSLILTELVLWSYALIKLCITASRISTDFFIALFFHKYIQHHSACVSTQFQNKVRDCDEMEEGAEPAAVTELLHVSPRLHDAAGLHRTLLFV